MKYNRKWAVEQQNDVCAQRQKKIKKKKIIPAQKN